MTQAIYINLPVTDLDRSRKFFEELGFSFNDQFSDDTALGMEISENISAMLLTHKKFAEFTPRAIADAKQSTEVLIALQVASRDEVDRIVEAAYKVGADTVRDTQDYGFMYGRSFSDLDGHIWELMWMDPSQIPADGEAE